VADQDEEPDPVSCWEPAELEPAAEEAEEVVVAAVCLVAMPAPRPKKSTPLSMPATTRDRAAGWRRRTGRRVAGGGCLSITGSSHRVDLLGPSLRAAAGPGLHPAWESAGCRTRARSQPTARQAEVPAKVAAPASPPKRLDKEPPSKEANHMDSSEPGAWRRWGGRAALAAGGLLVGGVLVGTLTASAANNAASSGTGAADQSIVYPDQSGRGPRGNVDESKSQRPDEHLLSGDTASKVRAAALAKYPGATVLRVETDSDGVYEAHLRTSDGQRHTVEVDRSFKVTGEEAAPRHP
jgi:hypothetical protein